MLQSLRIRNLAIVEDLRVEFGDGLNVITGETGAGKSVIVGALNLILGDRADKSLLRAGSDQCTVEAVFEASAPDVLAELGLPETGDLIIRRQFSATGTNKNFVNDSPVTLQTLKRLGDQLVDMHGPHDHQSLLSREFQLDLLDVFGHIDLAPYRESYRLWLDLQRQRAELDADSGGDVAQQMDFLRFQVKEIEEADLDGLDENELLAEHTRVANAARILELAESCRSALVEDESAAFNALATAQRQLAELAGIVPEAETWRAEAAALAGQVQELAQTIIRYAQRIDADPQRLAWLEERLSAVQRLKRKYGGDLSAVLAFLGNAKQRLHNLETRGVRAAELDKAIATAAGEVEKRGRELRKKRQTVSKKLATAITKELRDLGFAHGAFDVALAAANAPGPAGMDEIEFAFTPNAGEPARPLRQIASSGEVSRVMLAVKVVLAAHDKIPVLVFDEIDANVGGEMGNAIAERLRTVAGSRQVLCITHLPQVAARGANHFVVTKQVRVGRTLAGIHAVTGTERVEEVSRMLGGKNLTSVTTKHAEELLKRR
jgi:DNA repair protein RecN (Recombination protein N)